MPDPDVLRSARPLGTAALAALAGLLAACGQGGYDDPGTEITAVATTTHVADLVRQVGGERVDVDQFLTPGADPHEYEPRPSDALAVEDAAVVFESGDDLDEWLGGVIEGAGGDAEVVTLADAVRAHAPVGKDGSDSATADDPHWWQDPRNAVVAVDAIADALARADPAGARTYRRNADSYKERIQRLDARIARCMESIPDESRKLVTTHDAYGQFAARYDIEVIGAVIPSRSTQARPSTGETDALVSQIQAEGVRAIFPESPIAPELEQAVADESGAMVGDPLWGDSLGPAGSQGETYLEALASDAEAMAEGFIGEESACRIEAYARATGRAEASFLREGSRREPCGERGELRQERLDLAFDAIGE